MKDFYPFCIIPHVNKKYFISHSFDFASCLYKTTFPNNPNARWVYWVLLLSITPTHKKDVHFEKFKKTMSRTVRVVKIKVMPMHNGSIGCIWQMHNPSWFPMHNSPLRGSLCIEKTRGCAFVNRPVVYYYNALRL